MHTVHITWFNLSLKQKVKNTIKFFANNTKIADFRLINDWLLPSKNPIFILVNIYPNN